MAAAPLPPHERPWRHPSELAPTAAVVEPSSTRSRAIAFSSGAVAAVLVAVMVVSITPRPSSAPSAVSATTTPGRTIQLRSPAEITVADNGRSDDVVRVGRSIFSDSRPAALIGAPNAISTAPTADLADDNIASVRPDPDDRVIVLTSTFTYDVAWGEVADLLAPVGSIVMTPDGELLATFLDTGLRLLFD